MLVVRLAERIGRPAVLAVPVRTVEGESEPASDEVTPGVVAVGPGALPAAVAQVAEAFLAEAEHTGGAGSVQQLALPLEKIGRVLFTGVGDGSEIDWRKAGAAIARAAAGKTSAAVLTPTGLAPEAVAGLTEGLMLASYRYRLANKPDDSRKLRTVTVVVDDADAYAEAHESATVVAESICLARDLTNQPSADKSPAKLAAGLTRTAGKYGVTATVREPEQLAKEGFGGILAVGGGSSRGPRLLELRWAPRGAKRHIVLVGKGITFDTGGVSIKPLENMLLMRKDMGGVGTVAAAVIGAARLKLPVKITVLAPLAENMVGGDSYRPGDVVRHYGGLTSEVLNTDAEGRMVLADALAYAARRLKPDVLLDFATLTGAAKAALGKRTAAVLGDNDALVKELVAAGEAVGERMWRLPLHGDYAELIRSDVADMTNVNQGMSGAGGAITAGLFLREFAGEYADRWAHVDMSATSWIEKDDGELAKYATGWGVRTLLSWLGAPGAQ
ncbi:MAG: leucyl aminopeptidase family protein [Micromonosporaceae bacterium]